MPGKWIVKMGDGEVAEIPTFSYPLVDGMMTPLEQLQAANGVGMQQDVSNVFTAENKVVDPTRQRQIK